MPSYLDRPLDQVRRKDRQLTDADWIERFLRQAPFGHLAVAHQGQPMPVSDIERTSVFRMVVEERVAKHNVKPADYPAYPCPGESFIDAERNAGRVTMQWKKTDDGAQ